MRTIASFANGAVTLVEDAGVFTLSVDESLALGGGEAAGIVKVAGKGSVVLDAALGLKLGEAVLNSHLPEALNPLAAVVEGVVNQAVASLG